MARKPKKFKPPSWFDEIAAEEFKRVEKILREEEVDFTPKDIKSLEAYSMNKGSKLDGDGDPEMESMISK